MSSSLVWLPPGKYDSIKSLWQDQYIWSALPVDNTIPLHQTSFIDFSEGDAKTARSRASTLRSRASTGSIRHVSNAEAALEQDAQVQPYGNVESTRQPNLTGEDDPGYRGSSSRPAISSTRPRISSPQRLRSFHLPARMKSDPLPSTTDTLIGDAQKDIDPVRQDIIVVDNEHSLHSMVTSGPPHYEHSKKSCTPDREAASPADHRRPCGRFQQHSSEQEAKVSIHCQDLRKPSVPLQERAKKQSRQKRQPNRHVPEARRERKVSNRPRQSQRMSLKLDLNLDIEVELKVTLHGDLTLSLLS